MGQQEKAQMYNALKEAGVPLDKHYRNYTEDELRPAYERMIELQAEQAAGAAAGGSEQPDELDAAAAAFFGYGSAPSSDDVPTAGDERYPDVEEVQPQPGVPVAERDPNEFAGQRQNTNPDALEPIRVDEQGRTWYQEEVRKPAYPKPRGRRKLRYIDTGTKTVQAKAGEYSESFEVAGDEKRESEVRITLPSYQVGIYSDPRFPFKIHTYNDQNGFDYFDVIEFYGGVELVPAEVKKVYISSDLCFDIRTTVRAIEQEARRLQLQGRI